MAKEFLHEVVKKREQFQPFTIPQPRISDSMLDAYGRLIATPYVNGGTVVSATPRVPDLSTAHVGHIEIHPSARTAVVNIAERGRVEGQLALEFIFLNDRRTYLRTNTIIGRVPQTMVENAREVRMLTRHAYSLVNNHGCYPDYNIIDTLYRNQELFAISYACAHCGRRFSGVE